MNHGSVLFRAIRALTNKTLFQSPLDGRMAMAVEAVSDASENGSASINDIAVELGIDQSGTSRLITQAITAGLVDREKSTVDGRSRQCSLTPAGKELHAAAQKWQEEVFTRLTSEWTTAEKRSFVKAMVRLSKSAKAQQ